MADLSGIMTRLECRRCTRTAHGLYDERDRVLFINAPRTVVRIRFSFTSSVRERQRERHDINIKVKKPTHAQNTMVSINRSGAKRVGEYLNQYHCSSVGVSRKI